MLVRMVLAAFVKRACALTNASRHVRSGLTWGGGGAGVGLSPWVAARLL